MIERPITQIWDGFLLESISVPGKGTVLPLDVFFIETLRAYSEDYQAAFFNRLSLDDKAL